MADRDEMRDEPIAESEIARLTREWLAGVTITAVGVSGLVDEPIAATPGEVSESIAARCRELGVDPDQSLRRLRDELPGRSGNPDCP